MFVDRKRKTAKPVAWQFILLCLCSPEGLLSNSLGSSLCNNRVSSLDNRVSSSLDNRVSNFLNRSFLNRSFGLVSARSERNGYDSSEHKY